jgi:hypothetical protein
MPGPLIRWRHSRGCGIDAGFALRWRAFPRLRDRCHLRQEPGRIHRRSTSRRPRAHALIARNRLFPNARDYAFRTQKKGCKAGNQGCARSSDSHTNADPRTHTASDAHPDTASLAPSDAHPDTAPLAASATHLHPASDTDTYSESHAGPDSEGRADRLAHGERGRGDELGT